MSFRINKITLETNNLKVNALAFIPNESKSDYCCAFTHGYTSHKGSILPWAQKMMELSIPTMLFDLPGHFLGSFEEVQSFEIFKEQTHELFDRAHEVLGPKRKLISGGHSLGALFSLIHAKSSQPKLLFCAGLGLSDPSKTHLFQTPFFKDTMNLRSELISKSIAPEVMFPWISKTKQNLSCENKKITLVAGKDDIIIDREVGLNRLGDILKKKNNVEIITPPSLPHHQPERAGVYLKQTVKSLLNLP